MECILTLGDEDLNAYKYNEEKTLSWLQRKTERVAEVLKQKGIHVSGGAVSATFVKSGKPDPADTGKHGTNIFTYLNFIH
jgi:ribonuclease H2 subunit B